MALLAAVVESHRSPLADGVEHQGQGRKTVDSAQVHQRGGIGMQGRLPAGPQLQQRIPADRLAQVDSGNGQVQGGLLLCLQAEVGKVVGVRIDPVPELVLPRDRDHQHGHALIAQQPLVPFESLAAGSVGVRISRHPIGDFAETERTRGIEKHQQQVGDPFEAIKTLHRGQSRARRARS